MRTRRLLIFITILSSLALSNVNAQFYSLKTNVIGDAVMNFNVEFSATLNRKWSIHFPLQFNPYTYDTQTEENRKLRNLTFSPGLRWWIKESYMRGFMGVYTLASRYDISHIWDKNRYNGYAFGLGISYGHAWAINKHWNVEAEIGPVLVWTDYDKYVCKKCGRSLGHYNKWLPIISKADLSIVYLF